MQQYADKLRQFVMGHTEDVLKNPRSFIRYPFIDPGSVYDGNVWDWDTYWSVFGFSIWQISIKMIRQKHV